MKSLIDLDSAHLLGSAVSPDERHHRFVGMNCLILNQVQIDKEKRNSSTLPD
jgi:hypothetical protein